TRADGLRPWNLVQGTVEALTRRGAVAIDRAYFDRLGVSGLDATAEIRGQAVRVAAGTRRNRAFTPTPYLVSHPGYATTHPAFPRNKVSHFMARLRADADRDQVRRDIETNIAGIDVLAPAEFRSRSRSFWLFGTGAGAALFAGALLGVIVGTVIVAQTLYSST